MRINESHFLTLNPGTAIPVMVCKMVVILICRIRTLTCIAKGPVSHPLGMHFSLPFESGPNPSMDSHNRTNCTPPPGFLCRDRAGFSLFLVGSVSFLSLRRPVFPLRIAEPNPWFFPALGSWSYGGSLLDPGDSPHFSSHHFLLEVPSPEKWLSHSWRSVAPKADQFVQSADKSQKKVQALVLHLAFGVIESQKRGKWGKGASHVCGVFFFAMKSGPNPLLHACFLLDREWQRRLKFQCQVHPMTWSCASSCWGRDSQFLPAQSSSFCSF